MPGLIAMAMIQATYANNSASVFQARFDRYLNDVLASPMRPWEINLGAVARRGRARAADRRCGLLALADAGHRRAHPRAARARRSPSALALTLFAVLRRRRRHLREVLGPRRLRDEHRDPAADLPGRRLLLGRPAALALARDLPRQPDLLPLQAVRYGFLGTSDVSVWLALGVTGALAAVMVAWCSWLFRTGTQAQALGRSGGRFRAGARARRDHLGAVRRGAGGRAVRRHRAAGAVLLRIVFGAADPRRRRAAPLARARARRSRARRRLRPRAGRDEPQLLRGAGSHPAGHRGDDRVLGPAGGRGDRLAPGAGPAVGGARGRRASCCWPSPAGAGSTRSGSCSPPWPACAGRCTSSSPLGRAALPGADGVAMAMVVASIVPIVPGVAGRGSALLRPAVLLVGAAVGLLSTAIPYALETEALRRIPRHVFSVLDEPRAGGRRARRLPRRRPGPARARDRRHRAGHHGERGRGARGAAAARSLTSSRR